jgi:hypothetical protein
MRHGRLVMAFAAAALVAPAGGRAQDENSLTRDEVAQFKKKLVNVLEAIGQAPAGYSMEHESFNLPTDAYKDQSTGKYYPLSASAERNYGTQKKAQATSEELQKEYQKKLLEAQAKGDYQEMGKLSQEMQKKISETQLKAVEGNKEPVNVSVNFNANPNAVIDPDAVLFERPGVIALKTVNDGSPGKIRVAIYCDPVSLKDTKQLSRVNMKQPEGGVTRRSVVLSATIEFAGPAAEVEPWAKKVDTKLILAQIDAAR